MTPKNSWTYRELSILMTPSQPKPRWLVMLTLYGALAGVALVLAFLLRFDFRLPETRLPMILEALAIVVPLKIVVYSSLGPYRGWGRHVGMVDALAVLWANSIASGWFLLAGALWLGPAFPRSIYVLDFLLCFLLATGLCFLGRMRHEVRCMLRQPRDAKRILIYGAGSAGTTFAREVRSNPELKYKVVGFLDDDETKQDATLVGVPVLGTGRAAPRIVEQCRKRSGGIDEIVVALPSATGRQRRMAIEACSGAGVPCKIVPGIGACLQGNVTMVDRLRDLDLADLLGREPVRLDEPRIREALRSRTVLITGAAGSIGSELCRQIAGFAPTRLVALDQSESDLFRIDLELRKRFPDLDIVPCIGDIRNSEKVAHVFRSHRFDAVFHAAAYKHVPMMENNPIEAAHTNIVGTFILARAASEHRVSRFVMISSDKAVNPTNLMGLTKRVAELIVSSLGHANPDGASQFVSVRFGNVLGSNGSVVPIFQQQIADGGPVTVTHPDMRRYFMTIPEAVQLVLQASTMGSNNELFVLDMGEPVLIRDLAMNMIRLSGLDPEHDIEIRYTGVRPWREALRGTQRVRREGAGNSPRKDQDPQRGSAKLGVHDGVDDPLAGTAGRPGRKSHRGALVGTRPRVPPRRSMA